MTIELFKDDSPKRKQTYIIRNGLCRTNCVVDGLTIKDLSILMRKIDKILQKLTS